MLESRARDAEAHVAAPQHCAAYGSGIGRPHEHQHEHSITKPVQQTAPVGVIDRRLKTVTSQYARELLSLCTANHRHVAADDFDIPQVGLRGEVTGKLPQRDVHCTIRFARPGKRRPGRADHRHLFIPKVEHENTAATGDRRAAREHEWVIEAHDLDTKQALRMERVFVDADAASNTTVEGKNSGFQPTGSGCILRGARRAVGWLQHVVWTRMTAVPHAEDRVLTIIAAAIAAREVACNKRLTARLRLRWRQS